MGFGSLFAGFVKGASDYGVDQIKRREDAEQEIKKQALLEKLRLDTEKEMATFRDKLDQGNVEANISSPDYTRNKLVYRNKKGEVVSERDLTPDEVQAHNQDSQKATLELSATQASIANTNSAIASRAHDDAVSSGHLALDQQRTAAEIKHSNAETARLNGDDGLDGKKVLSKEYDRTVSELAKAGANPHQLAIFQTNWYDGVNNAKWTPSQQRIYLTKMRKGFTDNGGLLNKFNTGLSKLDQILAGNSGGSSFSSTDPNNPPY
jgi:hypothetical protein